MPAKKDVKRGIEYIFERDAGLRAIEFSENYTRNRDPGVIAFGIDLRILDSNGYLVKLQLQKVMLPDSLIRFIIKEFKGKVKWDDSAN